MTERPEPPQTTVGAVAAVANGLVKSLPAQFICLLLVNVIFLGVIFWYENNQTASRAALVGRILDTCFERAVTPPK